MYITGVTNQNKTTNKNIEYIFNTTAGFNKAELYDTTALVNTSRQYTFISLTMGYLSKLQAHFNKTIIIQVTC